MEQDLITKEVFEDVVDQLKKHLSPSITRPLPLLPKEGYMNVLRAVLKDLENSENGAPTMYLLSEIFLGAVFSIISEIKLNGEEIV